MRDVATSAVWEAAGVARWRVFKGICVGIVAAALFAGGAVVSRFLVGGGYKPLDLTLVRYLGCFPIALVALLVLPSRLRLDVSWLRLLLLLAVGGPPYHVLLLSGYAHATSGAGALLVTGLVPLSGLLIAWLALREVPEWQAVAGSVLVLAGLIVFGGLATTSAFTPVGLAIFALAAMAWAVLNHLVRVWRIDPLRLTITLAAWAPLFLPFYVVASDGDLSGLAPSEDLLLQLAYHGVLVAFGATLLFFAAIQLAGAHRAAALLALVPPCAALIGALALGETLTASEGVGAAIAVGGIVLISAYARPRKSVLSEEPCHDRLVLHPSDSPTVGHGRTAATSL
jgi:drug/metabolite transporter (DMT)-like permease